MKINKNNYEAYALDYLEGNLSPRVQKQMQDFLAKNPAIGEELDGLMEIVLTPDSAIVYSNKEHLKREEKSGVVIPFSRRPIVRLMVIAAALIGVFFVGQHLFPTKNLINPPAGDIVRSADSIPAKEEATVIEEVAHKNVVEEMTDTPKKPKIVTSPVEKSIEPVAVSKATKPKTSITARIEKTPKPSTTTQAIEETTISVVPIEKKTSPTINPQIISEPILKDPAPRIVEEPIVPIEETAAQVPEEESPVVEVPAVEPIVEPKPEPIAKNTKKRGRKIAFFPNLKDKFSPASLRDALLPESMTEAEK